MAQGYRYISADAHLEVSPEKWRGRVPLKYRDRAPRLVKTPDGREAILTENRPLSIFNPFHAEGQSHGAGVPPERWGQEKVVGFDQVAGGGSPEQRLREQDQDGMDAEILFSIAERSNWNAISDDDTYHAVVRAYNEWLAEEYCAVDPRRLIGMGLIPERGADKAIEEMEHCARIGLKGISIHRWPNGTSGPKLTADDDRFWAAAVDLNMPITIHGFASSVRGTESSGYPGARAIVTTIARPVFIPVDLIADAVFDRFPELQIYFAESEIGWVPHYLDRIDVFHKKRRFALERQGVLKPLSRRPSEIVKDHFLWGFIDDPVGVAMRHYIGVDKVMWSTDFPHTPSDWPHSIDTINRTFVDVPEDERYLMVAGNCIRFFHLEEFDRSLAQSRERNLQNVGRPAQ